MLVARNEVHFLDQLAALHYLRSLPYVDQNRPVVMGASFGGLQTSCPSNAEPVIASSLIARVGPRSGADMPTQPRRSRSGLHHRPLAIANSCSGYATHSRIDDLTDGLTFLS
jgi:hypothetical protein